MLPPDLRRLVADMDLRGAAQETELYYAIGARLANSREWPRWNAGSEFRQVREKSDDVRHGVPGAPAGVQGERGERGR